MAMHLRIIPGEVDPILFLDGDYKRESKEETRDEDGLANYKLSSLLVKIAIKVLLDDAE